MLVAHPTSYDEKSIPLRELSGAMMCTLICNVPLVIGIKFSCSRFIMAAGCVEELAEAAGQFKKVDGL
jgi:hypothetical protein